MSSQLPKNRYIDMGGRSFGRLRVTAFSHRGKNKRIYWACLCDCGNKAIVSANNLSRGWTRSCGCARRYVRTPRIRQILRERATTHGLTKTRTYESWFAMKRRCLRNDGDNRKYYVFRGIRVCERWMKFENFLADMGERSEGMSLDRINNDGNYEPGNCRWATPVDQANNRRSNKIYTHNGVSMTQAQWAKSLGIRVNVLCYRIKAGWPIEKALTASKRVGNKYVNSKK